MTHSWSGSSLRHALKLAADMLREAHIESPARDARLLLQYALNAPREYLFIHEHDTLTPDQALLFQQFVERRRCHEPVSRIQGYREFWSLEFKLSAATLDPRPDSETLIDAALSLFPSKEQALHILDLGTGSGCLLLALLSEYPKAAGVGVDLSTEAVQTARENAAALRLSNRAHFQQGDWAQGLTETFDLVVSNPPYIALTEKDSLDPDVVLYDPPQALFGGNDGLDAYRSMIPSLPSLLRPRGHVLLEIGHMQSDAVSALLERENMAILDVHTDLAGRPRVILAQRR